MNATNRQSSFVRYLVMIGVLVFCFLVVPFGLAGILPLPHFSYVTPAIIAVIAFSFALILVIQRKRISIDSATLGIVGLLFLASGTIQFGYSSFTQNMSVHDKIEFSRMMRPEQVSRGLADMGLGIAFILSSFATIKMKIGSEDNSRIRRNKIVSVVQICAGIFFLAFGIYTLIAGLQPLS